MAYHFQNGKARLSMPFGYLDTEYFYRPTCWLVLTQLPFCTPICYTGVPQGELQELFWLLLLRRLPLAHLLLYSPCCCCDTAERRGGELLLQDSMHKCA